MGADTHGRLLAPPGGTPFSWHCLEKAAVGAGGPYEPWLAGKSNDSRAAIARVSL